MGQNDEAFRRLTDFVNDQMRKGNQAIKHMESYISTTLFCATLFSYIVNIGGTQAKFTVSFTTLATKCHTMSSTVNSHSTLICELRDNLNSTDFHMQRAEGEIVSLYKYLKSPDTGLESRIAKFADENTHAVTTLTQQMADQNGAMQAQIDALRTSQASTHTLVTDMHAKQEKHASENLRKFALADKIALE
jgi:hypothetical protein